MRALRLLGIAVGFTALLVLGPVGHASEPGKHGPKNGGECRALCGATYDDCVENAPGDADTEDQCRLDAEACFQNCRGGKGK